VAKLPNEVDKRSSYIYLTALGQRTTNEIPDLLHEKLTNKLETLSGKELEKLKSAMALLVEFMEVENVDASPMITPGEKINLPDQS
jgi:DNA-binding MarR family transcriptional regulator